MKLKTAIQEIEKIGREVNDRFQYNKLVIEAINFIGSFSTFYRMFVVSFGIDQPSILSRLVDTLKRFLDYLCKVGSKLL